MAITQISQTTGIGMVMGLGVMIAWVWSVLNWAWFRPKKLERFLRQQGLSGNSYKLFHGDLKDTRAMRSEAHSKPMEQLSNDYHRRVRPLLYRTILQHGRNCLMWDGPVPVVNIGEVELVREVFCKYNEFQKPRLNPVTSLAVRGLASHEGHKWAQHRKLLNPAFHMQKLKLMLPAFLTSCSEMVRCWEQKVSASEPQEIDVCDHLTFLSADSISRAAFGSSYEQGKRIFELIKEQLFVASQLTESVYFPGLKYLPTEKNKKMKGIDKEIRSLISGIIEKRREGRETKDDLLGLLMESNSRNETSEKQRLKITTEDMIDECKLFYLAGQETTSALLIWTMILLSKHRDWQSRVREEVLEAFGQKTPDFEGLNRLKIMNTVFQEVLRLYPPAIELRRMVVEDNTKLGDLKLPNGTLINLPLLYIHHDPEVWGKDAKEFNPERFSQGITKASKGNMSFMAFGWGPRICIGSNFAMIEAKLALSMVLQRFTFEISPSYVHAPSAYGLLHPQFGAPILFRGFNDAV